MYKVFINGNLLIITKTPVKNVPGFKKITTYTYKKAEIFKKLIDFMDVERAEKFCCCVHGEDLALMWKKFRKNFELVNAGGGLVRNQKNKILFIFRNGKWDLPKGKAEPGELPEQTALREVKEECAMQNLILVRHLIDTYHTYGSRMNRKLKKTSWYRMYSEDKKLQPQLEEGITRIKWVKEEKLAKPLANTYASIADVVRAELASVPVTPTQQWHAMTGFE
jgi:8-oxo-dGTP pyrophosphatase MutT (NUDIX family)